MERPALLNRSMPSTAGATIRSLPARAVYEAFQREISHSTQFSGGVDHCSSKASRREDLEIEQPIACWDCPAFHFHPTLASMLGAPLIRDQVVQMGQPAQKRLLAPFGVMAAFHREQLPLDGVMGLIQ